MDIEYTDHAKIKPEDFHSTKANMSLLKELLKDREKNDNPKEKENSQSKEDAPSESPLSKSTNPHPDPKRKKFRRKNGSCISLGFWSGL